VFYPVFNEFCNFLKSKGVDCFVEPDSVDKFRNGGVRIYISIIHSYNDVPTKVTGSDLQYVSYEFYSGKLLKDPGKINFVLTYSHENKNDEIEFYKEYGTAEVIWRRIESGNTVTKIVKEEKMKFTDVTKDVIRKNLFDWFNVLVSYDGVLHEDLER